MQDPSKFYPTEPPRSNDWGILFCLNALALASQPQARPAVTYIEIAPVVNAVALAENLTSNQILAIVGEDAVTGMPVSGSDLWAKVASVTGGTFPERSSLVFAIRSSQTQITVASNLIIGTVESADLVITLNGGHGLSKVWFVVLPASYLVNS